MEGITPRSGAWSGSVDGDELDGDDARHGHGKRCELGRIDRSTTEAHAGHHPTSRHPSRDATAAPQDTRLARDATVAARGTGGEQPPPPPDATVAPQDTRRGRDATVAAGGRGGSSGEGGARRQGGSDGRTGE
jgi:hypothetical protein